MIEFSNGGRLIESVSELPNLDYSDIYLDFETTSGDPKVTSLDPWKNEHCKVLGACITGDSDRYAYYIPKRHLDLTWFRKLLSGSKRWINHNLLYDAAVAEVDLGLRYGGQYVDTLALAKLIDSDLTYTAGGYALWGLSELWLNEDIKQYEKKFEPYLKDSKDYGDIPEDIVAEYGCQDVLTNRKLHRYIVDNLPSRCLNLYATEVKLTKMLYEASSYGMRIDKNEVKKQSYISLFRMTHLIPEINDLVGWKYGNFRPNSALDCQQYFIDQNNLPILKYTPANKATFDKYTLSDYQDLDLEACTGDTQTANRVREVLKLCLEYRIEDTLNSLFWKPWLDLETDGILHPTLNQNVRSGRLSCRNPNAQQLNIKAKKQIRPREGRKFLSLDYSQIEYRVMIDFLEDENGIKAYNENPDTDFHQYIADMCGIPRKPAKNINFALGFGAGKAKVLSMLRANKELLTKNIDAEGTFEAYHRNLPNLIPLSKQTADVARKRGYVFNRYGRFLHLPPNKDWLAFNRIVQSTAADLMKESIANLDDLLISHDANFVCSVHDEALIEVSIDNESLIHDVAEVMCRSDRYSVPITVSKEESSVSWGDCSPVG